MFELYGIKNSIPVRIKLMEGILIFMFDFTFYTTGTV